MAVRGGHHRDTMNVLDASRRQTIIRVRVSVMIYDIVRERTENTDADQLSAFRTTAAATRFVNRSKNVRAQVAVVGT